MHAHPHPHTQLHTQIEIIPPKHTHAHSHTPTYLHTTCMFTPFAPVDCMMLPGTRSTSRKNHIHPRLTRVSRIPPSPRASQLSPLCCVCFSSFVAPSSSVSRRKRQLAAMITCGLLLIWMYIAGPRSPLSLHTSSLFSLSVLDTHYHIYKDFLTPTLTIYYCHPQAFRCSTRASDPHDTAPGTSARTLLHIHKYKSLSLSVSASPFTPTRATCFPQVPLSQLHAYQVVDLPIGAGKTNTTMISPLAFLCQRSLSRSLFPDTT